MKTYAGKRVLVGGAGISGASITKALVAQGAEVIVCDREDSQRLQDLAGLGATVLIAPEQVPDNVDDFIVSPGIPPTNPLVRAAIAQGIPVYSEPELAWRVCQERAEHTGQTVPWLAVTGTNGKTTTVTMTAAILEAAGLRATAAGNVGFPLLDAVLAEPSFEVLAVELSSFQLHWSRTLAPQVAALLNLADDHLDWHGGFDAYTQAKHAIFRAAYNGSGIAIGNADDSRVRAALAALPAQARQTMFTLGEPKPGQWGVRDGLVDGVLVDWATGTVPIEVLPVSDIRPRGSHNVANALAAAAMTSAHGVATEVIARGLRGYQPEPHRNEYIATIDGVEYINDSKATNPHAALASIESYRSIVWIAGGLLKGVDIDALVARVAPKLTAAVVLGADRAQILQALARHTPDLRVVELDRTDDGVMRDAVAAAKSLAVPEDTVLLAPAAASLDIFSGYPARGEAFAAAVRTIAKQTDSGGGQREGDAHSAGS